MVDLSMATMRPVDQAVDDHRQVSDCQRFSHGFSTFSLAFFKRLAIFFQDTKGVLKLLEVENIFEGETPFYLG